MLSIREQIIQAVITKLGQIRTSAGYNTDIGANVQRARQNLDPSELPASVVWPQTEEAISQYGQAQQTMPIKIEGFKLHGDISPSVVAELILADLIEAMLGIIWTLPFTSGGTYEVQVGDTIEGDTSIATGYVASVEVTSGSWAGGDAAGTITLRRVSGTFQAENLNVGTNMNVAAINGHPTGQDPVETTTGGLADQIEYAGGGTDEYPATGNQATGVGATVNVRYSTIKGDPYNQQA